MDERKTSYSNGFRVTMGSIEVQMIFKMDTPKIDETKNEIIGIESQEVADIRMNPVIAKQLYLALQQHIENYENKFGTLKLPE